MKNFIERLKDTVRDVGQELIDRADDLVGNGERLSRMTITVDFEPEYNMFAPTIEVHKTYACQRAIDRLMKPEEGE